MAREETMEGTDSVFISFFNFFKKRKFKISDTLPESKKKLRLQSYTWKDIVGLSSQ